MIRATSVRYTMGINSVADHVQVTGSWDQRLKRSWRSQATSLQRSSQPTRSRFSISADWGAYCFSGTSPEVITALEWVNMRGTPENLQIQELRKVFAGVFKEAHIRKG